MNIFSLPLDEFKKEVDKFLEGISPEELLNELKKCGLKTKGGSEMKKIMISQPMNGKTNEQIIEERHKLASELAEEGLQVIDTIIKEDAPKM